MVLPVFPNIQQPCYPFTTSLEDPSLSSKMENGFVVSRPKFTRIRESFILRWTALPGADYQALRNFWKYEVLGGSQEFLFQWSYPVVVGDTSDCQVYTVRFIGGEIKFDLVGPNLYAGEVHLQEV